MTLRAYMTTFILLLLMPVSHVKAGEQLYALMDGGFSGLSPSEIEVVDLTTFTTVNSFSLGTRDVISLAVSPDRSRLYVADIGNSEVAIYSPTGSLLGSVAVTAPRDLVLSQDGSRLFVTTGTSVSVIDTATNSVVNSLNTGSDTALAISLSRDGGTLAVSTTQGGTNPAMYLIDASTLSNTRIAITHPTLSAGVGDMAFTDTGRALMWDANRDSLYQVDVTSATQVTTDTIVNTPDGGSSSNFNNALNYSTKSALAYVHRDIASEIYVLDPATGSSSTLGGFSGNVFVSALTPLEDELLVSVLNIGAPDTLDVLDTVAGTFTRNAYTFSSSLFVRDMVVLTGGEVHWINASSGAWDTGANWDSSVTPTSFSDVFIDPAIGVTVTGPASTATVGTLTIGAQTGGTATLVIQGSGTLNVTGLTTITTRGRLTGTGTFNAVGGVTNSGEIDLGISSLQMTGGTLTNGGVIRGNGQIDNTLSNLIAGEVRATVGQRMVFSGAGNTNAGKIEAIGGEIEFTQDLTNAVSTGLITARDATLRFNGGLTNNGGVGLSFGTTDIFGNINNTASGAVVVSGNSNATFYDDVVNDGTIQVSTGSTAVYFGSVTGSGSFPGTGTNFFEGDLAPGASPAKIGFGGDVVFGALAGLRSEIGGLTAGGGFDQLNIAGSAALNGTLDVTLINGFTPVFGNSFAIINATSVTGSFTNELLPTLGGGLAFDVLYGQSDVTLRVVLVGDLDGDGFVGIADLNIVLGNWNQNVPPGNPLADPSGDGFIGIADLNVVLGNWNAGTPPPPNASASIPEPGTIVSLGLLALLLPSHRRGRTTARQ